MTSERNDPCTCGSGKKYKHCCLHQSESPQRNPFAAAPADAKPQAGAVEKAMGWLGERHRKGWQLCFTRLRDQLLSQDQAAKLGGLDHDTLSGIQINLTEWLLAEGEIQVQGVLRRIPDYLISPTGPNWTPGQRDWLAQLGQRPLRLYDVTHVVPGVQMTLCDKLKAESAPVVVLERSGSQGLTPGMAFGGRLMRVGDHFELSGAAYPFSMLAGPAVANRLRATEQELGAWPGLARAQGLVLMAAWVQQFVTPAPVPTIIDHYSGEPLEMTVDHYRVLDWDALARVLQGCADVEGDRMDGWSRTIDCDDGQIRALAHINPGTKADQIEVTYRTRRYADQGRTWFEAVTAGVLTFLTRKVTSTESALRQSKQPGALAASGHGLPSMASPEIAQAMAEIIRRTYAKWADEPIPALNHKTPRQAIQTAAGLERVKGLLRSYESNEEAQAKQQGRNEISYDFLWQSIGVSR